MLLAKSTDQLRTKNYRGGPGFSKWKDPLRPGIHHGSLQATD